MAAEILPAQVCQRYRSPPIIEAVIELIFAEPLSEGSLRKLLPKLKKNYTHSTDQQRVGATVDFTAFKTEFLTQMQTRLSSSDETDALIVQSQSLVSSRLAPYQGWQSFVDRFQRDIEIAHTVTGPRKLGRIGVRFVNRFDIPLIDESGGYEDYLAINLSLPSTIPLIDSYAWRFERDFPAVGFRAIVQSAVVEPEVPETSAFILDIDVIAQQNLPIKLDEIFDRLENMRELKNWIFETCITDKARETFSQ